MCTTISQLWRKNKKLSKKKKEKTKRGVSQKFYTFKEFVTFHNQGKLDSTYYMGDTVCPKTEAVPIPKTDYNSLQIAVACLVIGGVFIGNAIAKKE